MILTASVCGSRGWFFDSDEEHNEKVLNREVMRLKASIEAAKNEEKIVFLHYPPVYENQNCKEILNLLKENIVCPKVLTTGTPLTYSTASDDIVSKAF